MKKGLTLFLLLAGFALNAQTDFRFADSTAQWNVLETDACMMAPCVFYKTFTYRITGDTTISGLSYQKLTSSNGKRDFIREDTTGKVYHLDSTGEYMIYDFNVAVGDTFTIRITSWANSAKVKVLALDTVTYDKPRRRIKLCIDYWQTGLPCSSMKTYEAVDGIGAINSHFLYPGIDFAYTDGPSYLLLCYSENDSVSYHSNVYAECVLDSSWVSVGEAKLSNLSLKYNNGSIRVNTDSEYGKDTYLLLYDLTGRLILQKELTEQTTRIDVGALTKGVYLYSVQSNGKAIKNGKLVIE